MQKSYCKPKNIVPFAGKRAIKKQTQEKHISGGSAFNGIWAGESEVEPGYYSSLELEYPKCKTLRSAQTLPYAPSMWLSKLDLVVDAEYQGLRILTNIT